MVGNAELDTLTAGASDGLAVVVEPGRLGLSWPAYDGQSE